MLAAVTFAAATALITVAGPEAVSYTHLGWVKDVSEGTKAVITTGDWAGLLLVSIILPAVICPVINMFLKKIGWVKEGDLTLK